MNQNGINAGILLSKLSSDTKFEERKSLNPNTEKGTSFQSYLNDLQSRKNMTGKRQASESNATVFEKKDHVKSILKSVDSTASKLSVKTPERMAEKPSQVTADDTVKNVVKTDAEPNNPISETTNEKSNDFETVVVEAESNPSEVEKAEDGQTVNVIAEGLIQSLKELLLKLETLTPENLNELSHEDFKNIVGEITSKLSDIRQSFSELNPQDKVQINKLIDQLSNDASLESSLKPEVAEQLKQLFKEVKSELKEVRQDFAKVLSKSEDHSNDQSDKSGTVEKPINSTTVQSNLKNESAADLKDNALLKNSETPKNHLNDKIVNSGNVQVEKTKNTEASPSNSTNHTLNGFNAKLESASVNFSKTELSNLTSRNEIHQNIMDQLVNSPKMQIKQTEQGTMMTLKLNPEVLGNVEIKMEIVKGVLQAEINVENMIVKGAIETNLSDLKNALSDKGYHVESLNVSVGKDTKDGGHQQQQRNSERQGSLKIEEIDVQAGKYGFDTIVNDNQIDYRG